jgi:hypothetical protein
MKLPEEAEYMGATASPSTRQSPFARGWVLIRGWRRFILPFLKPRIVGRDATCGEVSTEDELDICACMFAFG